MPQGVQQALRVEPNDPFLGGVLDVVEPAPRVQHGSVRRLREPLVDLEKIVRESFYHPDFKGRSSIKRVLPAPVPEMTYEGLAIGDGDDASALFARMARGEKTEEECAEIQTNLLRYCKQDTLGMVRVHQALARQVT